MPREPLADLLAYSGHELRTPLTSLTLAVQMCADGTLGDLSPLQAETMAGAALDCARLRRLIEALTDPVLAGDQARLARIAVDLTAALARAVAAVGDLADGRGVVIADPRTTAESVVGDPDRLTRALGHGFEHALAGARRGSTIATTAARDGECVLVTLVWEGAIDAPNRTMPLWLCERLLQAMGGSVAAGPGRLVARLA